MRLTKTSLMAALVIGSAALFGGDPPPAAAQAGGNTAQNDVPPSVKQSQTARGAARAARLLQLDAPLAYKDAGTGIVIYVETDRRHVVGIDQSGEVVWGRDLHEEIPERIKNLYGMEPLIYSVHAPMDWTVKQMASRRKSGPFAGIGFLNQAFGVIDVRTGEFTDMGND